MPPFPRAPVPVAIVATDRSLSCSPAPGRPLRSVPVPPARPGVEFVAGKSLVPRPYPLSGFDVRVAQVVVNGLLGNPERTAHTDRGQLA